ncbi:hypothetical protein QJS04_geneDACA023697 [Acorus gramineus]|uniref:Core Histone H2A/H2B/H3 domain-containing protein n=1 Tax=Acorus gramineus TaxID=55184 RepID=A0AAV9BQN9_ACOGR|nr:hypothetical protein QJS04_geneDACA023697 [Acorus gramineus]
MAVTKRTARMSTGGKAPRKRLASSAATVAGSPPLAMGGVRKARRLWRRETVALREVLNYQKSLEFLVREAPFRKLLREVGEEFKTQIRFRSSAFGELHEAVETHLLRLMDEDMFSFFTCSVYTWIE